MDVELWQGLLETFQVRSAAPDWLIEPTAKPRKLTAKQFHDLALSTEDEREINAIALFMWMQNLRFDEFALFRRQCCIMSDLLTQRRKQKRF